MSARASERVRRIKIGSYPVIGFADAREKARANQSAQFWTEGKTTTSWKDSLERISPSGAPT